MCDYKVEFFAIVMWWHVAKVFLTVLMSKTPAAWHGTWPYWDCHYCSAAKTHFPLFKNIYIYNQWSSTVHLVHPVSPKWHTVEEISKVKRCSPWRNDLGKLIILLLPAWVWVQAKLFPHYFLYQESIRIMTTMGFWWQWACKLCMFTVTV